MGWYNLLTLPKTGLVLLSGQDVTRGGVWCRQMEIVPGASKTHRHLGSVAASRRRAPSIPTTFKQFTNKITLNLKYLLIAATSHNPVAAADPEQKEKKLARLQHVWPWLDDVYTRCAKLPASLPMPGACRADTALLLILPPGFSHFQTQA
ncbi:hypothetical protein ElyMa_000047200 [Elysia marginata]|uniref:Uncharacterized protein n=1 Tax=Elysia marginata TaxID=1093978 RepID=A0AAV4EEM8_9GAST|nr:hypothetical protein ElyMa_000047200 [Elysia marginata]